MATPGSRVWYMVNLMEALDGEHYGHPPVNNALVLSMKAAASGDRDQFDHVLEQIVPEPIRNEIRALAEQTVFAEIADRELLATNPTKSKGPSSFATWHVEIRHVLELLLGPREGHDWEFRPAESELGPLRHVPG